MSHPATLQRLLGATALVLAVVTVVAIPAAATTGPGTIHYLATDGDDANDGSAEAPWATLQHAVPQAASGDTILLAEGTYTGPGNRDIVLSGKTLAFASAGGDPDACIIDGEMDDTGSGVAFSIEGDLPALSFRGLTFTRFTSGAITVPRFTDPAVGRATVQDCAFIDITGRFALYTGGGDFLQVSDCVFRGCIYGLWLDNVNTPAAPREALIERCLFAQNMRGAETTDHLGSSWLFRDCVFRGNEIGVNSITCKSRDCYAAQREVTKCDAQEDVRFEDCLFLENGAGFGGFTYESLGIRRCEFTENGIGLDFSDWNMSRIVIEDCDIHHNTGDGLVAFMAGGAIRNSRIRDNGGDGLRTATELGFDISECVISGNGGYGIRSYENHTRILVTIDASTIVGNGGGIDLTGPSNWPSVGEETITNSIIAFNLGEGLLDEGITTYANCDVYGNGPDLQEDGFTPGVDGNISLDPYFCDPDNGNFWLAANSPCRATCTSEQIGALATQCESVPEGSIIIDVEPDESNAPWQLVGPDGWLMNGAGDATFAQVTPGDYTVTWLTVDGWTLPEPSVATQAVRLYQEKAFRGIYTAGVTPSGNKFGLEPNQPNPFNPTTMIRFGLDRPSVVDVTIYDLAGRRVRTLAAGETMSAGLQALRWDGTDNSGRMAATGIYFVQLKTGVREDTQRIMLVK